jgi:hypothetical protein
MTDARSKAALALRSLNVRGADIARACGVSAHSASLWLRGIKLPNTEAVAALEALSGQALAPVVDAARPTHRITAASQRRAELHAQRIAQREEVAQRKAERHAERMQKKAALAAHRAELRTLQIERLKKRKQAALDVEAQRMIDSAARKSVVYFVEAEGLDLVKIGFTTNLRERLKAYRCECPVPIDLCFTVPGGRAEEKALHFRFRHAWRKGEWFQLSAIEEDMRELKAAQAIDTSMIGRCIDCGRPRGRALPKVGRSGRCRECAAKERSEPKQLHACERCGAPAKKRYCSRVCVAAAMRKRPVDREKHSQAMQRAWDDPMYHHRRYMARVDAGLCRAFVLVFCECGARLGKGNKSGRCWACMVSNSVRGSDAHGALRSQ